MAPHIPYSVQTAAATPNTRCASPRPPPQHVQIVQKEHSSEKDFEGRPPTPVHELPTLPEHCRGIGTRPVNPAGDPEPPGTRRRDLETSHSRRRGRAHAYCSRRHARARASATRSHTCSCGTLQHTSTEASERKDSASASSINGRHSLLHMPHKHHVSTERYTAQFACSLGAQRGRGRSSRFPRFTAGMGGIAAKRWQVCRHNPWAAHAAVRYCAVYSAVFSTQADAAALLSARAAR